MFDCDFHLTKEERQDLKDLLELARQAIGGGDPAGFARLEQLVEECEALIQRIP